MRDEKINSGHLIFMSWTDPPNLEGFGVLISPRIRTSVIFKRTHTELDFRLLTRVKTNIMKIYEIQKLPQLSLCRVDEIVP